MNLLTRHSDYAVQALCYISRSQTSVSVTELCRELGMPKAFLRGILQKLTAAGILHSAKGKGGGFSLARPPEKILLIEVMVVFQGPVTFSRCVFRKKPCSRQCHCELRKCLTGLEKNVIDSLSAITIKQLASSSGR